ncbi:MAG: DNA repair protein RecN [Xanthomonadales bacterium]|nr:DNA repair protein RecN [Xanthomonadales bacterium]MBP6077439.1 DNA repair protein RecN [Xanthomonadales bacterium]MBP7623230.1 DNA repair protein RecN [Xanthomonadales bacterium]
MLRTLFVKDFAIIDGADVNFASGMSVLTGETGAGKSLLVDALMLLAGGRGDAGVVRHGAERAEMSAEFDLRALPAPRAWLREQELDDEEHVRLRRVIRADGSSRAWINDRPVSLAVLREAAAFLVEIHGQHEHQALLSRKHQLALLDAFAQHPDRIDDVQRAARQIADIDRQIAELAGAEKGDPDRLDYLRFQHQELKKHALPGESYARLVDDHRRLAHAATLLSGSQQLIDALDSDDDRSATSLLAHSATDARKLAQLDPALAAVAELLESAGIQVVEAINELERYRSGQDLDPQRYGELDAQLGKLHELSRKHRVPAQELGLRLDELADEIDRLQHAGTRIDALRRERDAAQVEYTRAAKALSESRRFTATTLAARVTGLLRELAIAGAFEIQIEATDDRAFPLSGRDDVEFVVSPNPGQPGRPLRKIASGGELARISLAIEVAAIGSDDVPVMVFDEVDSGIGGATAEVVGRKLRELGSTRQVLCVTHLAQVAAQGHQHFAVRKTVVDGQTRTRIDSLEAKPRVDEIARMLGGVEITSATRSAAKEMIAAAR